MKNKTTFVFSTLILAGSFVSMSAYADHHSAMTNGSNDKVQAGTMQKMGMHVDDTVITAKIKTAFVANSLLSPFKIGVATANGVVELSGLVESDIQYEQAVTIAESTEGVKDVDADNLKVKDSKSPLNDTYITAKIKGSILRQKLMGNEIQYWPVNIETKNGIVYLSGSVDSEAQKDNLIKLIEGIKGVRAIKSDIKIKDQNNDS